MRTVDKITREDLRLMRDGETRTYKLPSPGAVESGKTTAYLLAKLEGGRFECARDLENCTLTITRYDR